MVLVLVPPSICVELAVSILVSPAWVAKLQGCGIIDARDPMVAYVLSEIVALAGAFVMGPAWRWTMAQAIAGQSETNGTSGFSSRRQSESNQQFVELLPGGRSFRSRLSQWACSSSAWRRSYSRR